LNRPHSFKFIIHSHSVIQCYIFLATDSVVDK
jgi:hypothetical protein